MQACSLASLWSCPPKGLGRAVGKGSQGRALERRDGTHRSLENDRGPLGYCVEYARGEVS